MSDIEVRGTPDALEYVERIVSAMMRLFGITRSESVGRVNLFWAHREFFSEMAVKLLKRERPDFWAKTIYYPDGALWWKGEDGLEARRYP